MSQLDLVYILLEEVSHLVYMEGFAGVFRVFANLVTYTYEPYTIG